MADNMEILYRDNELEIQSYDFIAEYSYGMVDFFIYYKGIGYSCSAFCLNDVGKIISQESFFWSIGSIILKEITKESIVNAVLCIVSDESLCLDDIFVRLDD
ncbi:hypothetical protein [Moraxella catarrhalis]|uniref:hypothetical protein n=2 Tax=Moraxella catarrhalis TaxID=480 RepID=UPI0002029A01|nr:hypothetical protein [Moraxella catarrhalis]EGE10992.1 hypothetical protein E9G_05367 [Moraxella catarrhalis 7169]EGE13831.1 hypothetical protein E9M_03239 [Moraxella catarrhalis 46P47B1]EGE18393.1 hypothetical protein E9Q_04089 [Moraxella catarrhalis BC1]EGE20691.1 hypothetical protein E9U_03088 [Moraxella catarrhalis BC8]EGE22100.1 hypothetical protein E9S_01564 [Moraxella catarrhalis BC7]